MDEKRFDEIEDNIIAATNMAEGMSVPIIAVALAMIDAGVIKKGRLLEIIASLRTIQEAEFDGRFGVLEEATLGLERLETFLEGLDWQQGRVVELLHLHEAVLGAKTVLRGTLRRPPPETE